MILQQMNLVNLEAETSQSAIKSVINRLFWSWYHLNGDMPIKIKKWFINISITVGSLHGLFELLFGQDPKEISL